MWIWDNKGNTVNCDKIDAFEFCWPSGIRFFYTHKTDSCYAIVLTFDSEEERAAAFKKICNELEGK